MIFNASEYVDILPLELTVANMRQNDNIQRVIIDTNAVKEEESFG